MSLTPSKSWSVNVPPFTAYQISVLLRSGSCYLIMIWFVYEHAGHKHNVRTNIVTLSLILGVEISFETLRHDKIVRTFCNLGVTARKSRLSS